MNSNKLKKLYHELFWKNIELHSWPIKKVKRQIKIDIIHLWLQLHLEEF